MKTKVIIIGAGARGQCYGQYARTNSAEMEIVGIAEPKKHLQQKMIEEFNVNPEFVFDSYEELLSKGVIADAVFICTQDNEHVEPAIMAIKTGYKYLMVEKPIDEDIDRCKELLKVANEHGAVVQVCHSLRYTMFYRKLKEVIDSGIIGDVVHITHLEAVGTFHYAHSFVRGDWNNSEDSSPMILAKCCHDTDLILYLTGKSFKKINSYGSLKHFVPQNAPEGSTDRCINGCKISDTCPYSAMQYFGRYKDHLFREYAVEKEGYSDIETALKEGRYGRCVYRSNNNVVDHQTVNILLEDDVTANLTMMAFSNLGRETRIFGTMGEIYAMIDEDEIVIKEFGSRNETKIHVAHPETLHGGADTILVRDFINSVKTGTTYTELSKSIQSHEMCIEAEKSRIENL